MTPEELSQWITENIMGECWHNIHILKKGGFIYSSCNKCDEPWRSNSSYATDLNLAMKAYWKYAETAIQPSMIIKLKFGSVLVTISCSVLTQRIDYFSTGTSGGEATAICLAIKKAWDGREP